MGHRENGIRYKSTSVDLEYRGGEHLQTQVVSPLGSRPYETEEIERDELSWQVY